MFNIALFIEKFIYHLTNMNNIFEKIMPFITVYFIFLLLIILYGYLFFYELYQWYYKSNIKHQISASPRKTKNKLRSASNRKNDVTIISDSCIKFKNQLKTSLNLFCFYYLFESVLKDSSTIRVRNKTFHNFFSPSEETKSLNQSNSKRGRIRVFTREIKLKTSMLLFSNIDSAFNFLLFLLSIIISLSPKNFISTTSITMFATCTIIISVIISLLNPIVVFLSTWAYFAVVIASIGLIVLVAFITLMFLVPPDNSNVPEKQVQRINKFALNLSRHLTPNRKGIYFAFLMLSIYMASVMPMVGATLNTPIHITSEEAINNNIITGIKQSITFDPQIREIVYNGDWHGTLIFCRLLTELNSTSGAYLNTSEIEAMTQWLMDQREGVKGGNRFWWTGVERTVDALEMLTALGGINETIIEEISG